MVAMGVAQCPPGAGKSEGDGGGALSVRCPAESIDVPGALADLPPACPSVSRLACDNIQAELFRTKGGSRSGTQNAEAQPGPGKELPVLESKWTRW